MLDMGYSCPNGLHISQDTRKLQDCNTQFAGIAHFAGEAMGELTAGPVIDRIQQVLGVRTDIAVAGHFGHSNSTVSSWRARNKVPYEECVNLAIRKGVSLDWLLLGTGEPQAGAHGISDVAAGYGDEPRLARLMGFLRTWFSSHGEDDKAWLEMQMARAVPEYAEWVAARARA
jgi:hypothetical protein